MKNNSKTVVPVWLSWAREIQAIAKTGNHYAVDGFQRQLYTRLDEIPEDLSYRRTEVRHIYDAFQAMKDPGYSPVFD